MNTPANEAHENVLLISMSTSAKWYEIQMEKALLKTGITAFHPTENRFFIVVVLEPLTLQRRIRERITEAANTYGPH